MTTVGTRLVPCPVTDRCDMPCGRGRTCFLHGGHDGGCLPEPYGYVPVRKAAA